MVLIKESSKRGSPALLFYFTCVVILLWYMLFNKSPRITLDENFLTIKRLFSTSVYSWEQVTNVSLSKKEIYTMLYIFGQPLNAMKLTFDDRKAFVIWGDMYSNMKEIRAFVTEKLNDKLHFIANDNNRHLNNIIVDKRYAGNVWTTFNTFMILGMILFFAIKLHVRPGKEILLLIPLAAVLFFYIIFGTQMNFFEIKEDKLIIRNHYFPWKKRVYNLKDIEEVSKETPYRRSTGLRILTYKFDSKLFCAGSLRDHTWKELLDDLSSLGIKTSTD